MKKISLKHRLLALALTLVMVFGMMPKDFAFAEENAATAIYFDPLDEWVEAGYTYALFYATGADDIWLNMTDSDGDGIYEVTLDAETLNLLQNDHSISFYVYEPGKSEFGCICYSQYSLVPSDGKNLFTAESNDRSFFSGSWSVYTPVAPVVTYVAETGGVKFETLAEAVAAAEPGATVKLLCDASGAGVVVNKSVTIDFGGFTYTLTEGVGSPGTPSNGLQLLAGNSVVLTNGTLKVADTARKKFYILVQNYADLTVSGMTLDGTNLDKWSGSDGDSYTLSINSGHVTVDGSTIIANNEGALAYAFDVCQYATYPAPSVKITSGVFSGNVDTGSIGAGSLSITGGSFTADVSPYVAEGYQLLGGSVRMDTLVTPLTGGTVTQETDGTIVVEVADVTLGWSDPASGREGGWWAGIKIGAPLCLTDDQLQSAAYYTNGNGPEEFWAAKDSTAAPHYMEAWVLLNPEIVAAEAEDDGYVTDTYKFNWTASDEQTVVFKVKTDSVKLLQEEQAPLTFNQEAVTMTYGDEVPANELLGGTGDGAVTYEIVSEGGADIIDLAADGTVTVKKVGSVTIQATKAASGKYAQATAAYTLTIEARPVKVFVNPCEKFYGEENPVFTYSLSEDGLDAYVIFCDIADDVVAGEYELTTAEAYIRENGVKSDNYAVTVVPSTMLVKRATRTIEFETASPEAVYFGITEFSNPIKDYPKVGEQTVTYSIVSANGISATINGEGKLTIDDKNAITSEAAITVRVVVGEDDGYLKSDPVEYTLTVKPVAVPETPYTLDGTERNGWYKTDVKMIAPEGYQIGFGTETKVPENWADSVTCAAEGENTYVYYLKSEAGISAPQTSQVIKIDKTLPELDVKIEQTVFKKITDKIFAIAGGFQVSVKFSDAYSGVNAVKITVKNENDEEVVVEGVTAELTAEQIAAGEYVFTVAPEFRNAIVVEATDLAGWDAVPYDTKEILIADGTAPVIAPEFTGKFIEVPGSEGETIYFSKDEEFGLKFTVTDNHLDLSAGILELDINGEKSEMSLSDGVASIALNKEGDFTVTANFTDIAGIPAEEVVRHYIVDKDDPVIHDLDFSSEPNKVEEVFFTNDEKFSVDITVTDTNYGLTDDIPLVQLDGKEVTGLTWTDAAAEDGKPGAKANLPLTEEGLHEITVTYTDGLTEVSRTYMVHLDFTPAEIDVSLNETELKPNGDRSYYNGAVTATIRITEANFDPALVEVAVVSKNAKSDDVEVADYTGFAKTGEWKKDHDTYTLELSFTVESNYTLTVDYTDQARNKAEQAKKEFTIDATDPEAPVVTYSESVDNTLWNQIFGGFFNSKEAVGKPAVATITVTDVTAGVKEFVVTSSDKDFIGGVVPAAQNGDTSTASVEIPAQYNGTLTVVAVDWAENESTTEDKYLAIVDTVDPVGNFELTPEVQSENEVKYFNGDIVMKATINEANYVFFENANIAVTKDGQPYTGGTQTGWARSPVATNTLTLTEDGDYVITVTYHDGSNNQMATWTSGKLTLDTTAPVITATNIKQNSANKDDTYGFVITVSDINLDVDTVKPVLTAVVRGEDGLYKTEQIDLGAAQVDANGETVQYIVENLEKDALYTLICTAQDMSKNETTEILLADGNAYKTVNFSINRSGSTFGFGNDATENLVNQYYVYSVYEDVVLVEVNVDPIETYTVTLNGAELAEGTDYTTEQTSNSGEWSKRTYIIKKDLFAEEGQYNIVVSSTDKTNTTAYSDIKDLAVAFVVDQTAPVLTISGLQEGGRYQTSEQTVTLIPTDEGGRLNSLKILVLDADGQPLTAEDGSDISVRIDLSGEELHTYLDENGGMVTFTIPTGLEMQVQVVCNDCAVNAEGLTNEYNELFRRVTVSENWFIIFYANKGAFYGSIGAVVAAAAVAFFLIKRKKAVK